MLYVCTANINRSAMAAALTARSAHQRGVPVRVSSASIMDLSGRPAAPNTLSVLLGKGIDASGHRSRTLVPDVLAAADVVLTMERAHLRAAAVLTPDAFAKTFTLKEFLRRALEVGPRAADEPVAAYLARVGAGREPSALLTDDERDEVRDPQGGPLSGFQAAVDELELLTQGVLYVLFGVL
ncbi:MAG: hypothetical protein AB7O92_03505 [Acidimicrobiia bacterium]